MCKGAVVLRCSKNVILGGTVCRRGSPSIGTASSTMLCMAEDAGGFMALIQILDYRHKSVTIPKPDVSSKCNPLSGRIGLHWDHCGNMSFISGVGMAIMGSDSILHGAKVSGFAVATDRALKFPIDRAQDIAGSNASLPMKKDGPQNDRA